MSFLYRIKRQLLFIGMIAAFCVSDLSYSFGKPSPVGTISIAARQVSFIVGGQNGGGILRFQGRSYKFKIGGLGVGGFGISKFEATGEVYDLVRASDFYGHYASARVGWAVGQSGNGQIWLQNGKGVVIHLWARRKGLMLSLGADAIQISPP